ncbi:hypothetical protein GIB67_016632 [Kingdonia uniflora]|uniref:Uncharacterized protein n=1 Tax=Kingdonia uniflora TaxID=39325 RepID=A0A7J7MZ88_9MAGN|nr:hypothetical protein GIB67_016632 [Kingdonia uniflora]
MAIVSSGGSSRLNPDAPLFIPAAVRQVEDFSPEWWDLVKTSTWFRHYWLNQEEQEAYNEENEDVANFLPESFDHGVEEDFRSLEAQIEDFIQSSELEEKKSQNGLEMDTELQRSFLGSSQERGLKSPVDPAKYREKLSEPLTGKVWGLDKFKPYPTLLKTPRDCGFWCWMDEYLQCPCGYGPCKLRSATVSKKRFYCCPLSKSKHERGYGFFKWFEEVNGESSTSTPSTTATPTFATSTTIKDLEIKYKIELAVAQAKIEMLQSITKDLAKINIKK